MPEPQTHVTLDDIITNLTASIEQDHTGASRITMNNTDLLSLLLAIRNEIRKR